MLTEMSNDDLKLGVTVKDTIRDHAEEMQTDALSETQRWPTSHFRWAQVCRVIDPVGLRGCR